MEGDSGRDKEMSSKSDKSKILLKMAAGKLLKIQFYPSHIAYGEGEICKIVLFQIFVRPYFAIE